jgi:hypothetical protein
MAFDRVALGEVVCPASIGQFDMGPTVAGSRSIFGYFIFRLRSRRAYNQGRAHWNTFLSIHPPPAQRNPEVRRAAFCTISVWARTGAQLNDVATGSHIWAERYDRSLADVFAVQDEITEAIVAAIEPQLYAAEDFRARRSAQRAGARLSFRTSVRRLIGGIRTGAAA